MTNLKDHCADCGKPRSPLVRKLFLWPVLLGAVLAGLAAVSLCMGRFSIWPGDFIWLVQERLEGVASDAGNIFFDVRLPRILAAMLVGASLSMAGGAYQGVFNNPMVSPDLLGASSGAALGASVGILCSFSTLGMELSAFSMGLLAVALTLGVSKAVGGTSGTMATLLTGIVVGSLFSALTAAATYLADPNSKMPEITFWMMGGLANASYREVGLLAIPFLLGGTGLMAFRWRLNVLTFGDEEAMSLGLRVGRSRLLITICATLLTASSVAVAGMVGWAGLIIPHLGRAAVGPNYKWLLPVSGLMGAVFLLLVDDAARTLAATEIPLSVLTSLVGAPFFILLLACGTRAQSCME